METQPEARTFYKMVNLFVRAIVTIDIYINTLLLIGCDKSHDFYVRNGKCSPHRRLGTRSQHQSTPPPWNKGGGKVPYERLFSSTTISSELSLGDLGHGSGDSGPSLVQCGTSVGDAGLTLNQ